MGEIIFHIILIVIMAVFFKESLDIHSARVADPIGPAGFPKAIIIISLILLLLSLYKTIKGYKQNKDQTSKQGIKELNIAFIGVVLSVILFVLFVEKLGFLIAAFLLMFILIFLLGQRKILSLAITSVIVSFAFTLVFGKFLSVPLPRGMGILKELSYLIF